MRYLKVVLVILLIAGISSVASADIFSEDFESYADGSALHGQGGWKGWNNTSGAGAPVSSLYAYSGSNSVEVVSSADLVHEFDLVGGRWELSIMQYIPTGTNGESWFILLNTYNDNAAQDWSVQLDFNLGTGTITSNYDGKEVNRTKIGDNAFIGSGTILIAPVSVGKCAITAGGCVVTKKTRIPSNSLAIGVPARIVKKESL